MTQAEKIAESGNWPTELDERATEVSEACKKAFEDLKVAPDEEQKVEILKNELGEIVFVDDDGEPLSADEGGQAVFSPVFDPETGEPVMGPGRLKHTHEHHGLHAYSYEELGDGSVVALWANDEAGDVKTKAFASMEEASLWTPRDERE
jgi:hypothetical protein